MPSEGDPSGLLPPPPPPRPDAREAAIAAAMRRFDGDEPVPVASRPRRWARLDGPRLGALVAAALVVTVGLPLWMVQDHGPPPSRRAPIAERAVPVALDAQAPASELRAAPAEAPPSEPRAARPVVQPAASPLAAAPVEQEALADAVAPAAPPPPPPPPPEVAAPEPPPRDGTRAFSLARRAESENANIEVTESPTSAERSRTADKAGAAPEAGTAATFSACTIDGPAVEAGACRAAIGQDRGAALVEKGLELARQGDLDGARAALDEAIRMSPRLAAAYHLRAELRRRSGDRRGAEADERRAAKLNGQE